VRKLKSIPVRRNKVAAPAPAVMVRSSLFPRHPQADDDIHGVLHGLLGDRVYESDAELDAVLAQIQSSGALDRALQAPAGDARQEAQRIVIRAYQTEDDDEAAELARQALALDPDNIDAQLLPIPLSTADSLPRLRELVALARQRLGEEAFAQHRGRFWEVAPTREYMRAQHKLALACFWAREFDQAEGEMEQLLELDRRDTLLVRELLLSIYLRAKQKEKAAALIARFDGHESALWHWGLFFFATLFQDEKARRFRMADAYRVNRHAHEYLLGFMQDRPRLRSHHAVGSMEEAYAAAVVLMPVVASDPEGTTGWFLDMLKSEAANRGLVE
jgi:tetratricopeptide (TPR) repeat protein